MEIDELKARYDGLLAEYNMKLGRKSLLQKQADEQKVLVADAEKQADICKKGSLFLQKLIEKRRIRAKAEIEKLVTFALRSIMGDDYRFEIQYEISRNVPNARFIVWERIGDKEMELDPVDGKGGSVQDVLSMALRAIFLRKSHPFIDGPFMADEEGESFDAENTDKIAPFLSDMSRQMKRQIISIPSHGKTFQASADRIIELERGKDKIARVKKELT